MEKTNLIILEAEIKKNLFETGEGFCGHEVREYVRKVGEEIPAAKAENYGDE